MAPRKNGTARARATDPPATTQKGDRITLVLDWDLGDEFRDACWQCDMTVKAFVTQLLKDHMPAFIERHRVPVTKRGRKRRRREMGLRRGPRLRLTARRPAP